MIEDKIHALLEQKYKDVGFEDCYTVEIVQNNTKLQVFIDSDSPLSYGRCQKISRYLEAVIDEQKWLGEKYTLEVSSPGATRPLVPRQFPKHIGRNVKVKVENNKFEGKLEEVAVDYLIVGFTTVEKIGKKKIKTEVKQKVNFDDIKEIKVILSF